MSEVARPDAGTDAPRAASFRRTALLTYGSTGGVLVLSVATGVLIARTLGPDGRGQLTSVITPTLLFASLLGLGCSTAVAYHQARHPGDASSLLGTWAVILAPAALIAILAGEVLLPTLLSAQSSDTLTLARLFMWTVVLSLALEPFLGILTGDQDFGFVNVLRIVPSLVLAGSYALLWAFDGLTVGSAVLANVAVAATMLTLAGTRVLRRHPFGRADLALGKRTLWYGVRAHGDSVASSANTRLDLLIMPAFISSAGVGLYSVAANVAGIILAVCGSIASIVMSAAARRGPDGSALVIAALQMTLIVGAGMAILIGVVAGWAVTIVYGTDFAGSVTPLRLLLPGVVLMAGAYVLAAGLYAVNRPFTAFSAQLIGMLVTVPGLVIFLPHGGVTAAAIVSTVSYSVVFVATLTAYLRTSTASLRDLFTIAPWMRRPVGRSG